MAPEKSPAFQFYPKDFLTDSHVVAMTLPERGAYITLLCLCWLDHSLPADLAALARLCRVPTTTFTKLWPALEPCFTVVSGRLIQPRIERERRKQTTYRAMKAAAGQKGGRASVEAKQTDSTRQTNTRAESSPPSSSSSSSSPSSSPERENITPLDEAFEQFAQTYPEGRQADTVLIRQDFLAACAVIGFPALLARLDEYKRSAQWIEGVIPSMKTFFAEKRWKSRPPVGAQTPRHAHQVGYRPIVKEGGSLV